MNFPSVNDVNFADDDVVVVVVVVCFLICWNFRINTLWLNNIDDYSYRLYDKISQRKLNIVVCSKYVLTPRRFCRYYYLEIDLS